VRNDADAAGELAGQAAEKIAAACWILGSRLREREPGHLAAMTRDAVNGYQTGRRREGAPSRPAHRGRAPRGRPSDWTAGTSVSNPSENERVCKVASPNTCSAQGFLLGGVMLPEDEQRQLQEIEQALCRDDPKFVRLMRAGDPWVHSERKLLRGPCSGSLSALACYRPGRSPTASTWRRPAWCSWCCPWCGRWSAGGGTWPGSGRRVPGRGPRRRKARSTGPGRPGGPG